MPSISKEVKAAVDSARTTLPLEQMLAAPSTRLIKQGAEAKVYRTNLYPEVDILLKHRFPKRYRHPTLDAQLTRQRLMSEARALVRCLKADVRVPGLRIVDVKSGALGVEWIEGWSVREVLGGGQEEDGLPEPADSEEMQDEDADEAEDDDILEFLSTKSVSEDDMLRSIGAEIAKMHIAEIVHGDLTTSNMMVRLTPDAEKPFEIVLIDFGLSSASLMAEDRAVDLYVLERAFASTHPVLPGHLPHFDRVLQGYEEVTRAKAKKGEWERTEKRLEEVRMRGRKRSMVG
ncbi:hypothetical protein JCM3766R1_000762 [Sporobolomyces carnicolor]